MELKTVIYSSIRFNNLMLIYLDEEKIDSIAIDNKYGGKIEFYWPKNEDFKKVIKEIKRIKSNDIMEIWSTISTIEIGIKEKKYIIYFMVEED